MASTELQYARSLYVDVEQLCWLGPAPANQTNSIIQIGLVEVDNLALRISREVSYFVRPQYQYEVSKYCTDLTGITDDQLRKYGRPLNEVMNRIIKDFGPKNKMTFAWGNDDADIRTECLTSNSVNPFNRTIIDLGVMFRSTFHIKQNMALKNALQYLHIPFEGRAHNALVDASNLARLHCEMLQRTRQSVINEKQNLV